MKMEEREMIENDERISLMKNSAFVSLLIGIALSNFTFASYSVGHIESSKICTVSLIRTFTP